MKEEKKFTRQWIIGVAILTGVIFALQFVHEGLNFTAINTPLSLIPIIVGVIIYDTIAASWFGFVFGLSTILSNTAKALMPIDLYGTILILLISGVTTALAARGVYYFLKGKNETVAVFAASFTAPVVKSGMYVVFIRLFFMQTITKYTGDVEKLLSVAKLYFGKGFVIELAVNLIAVPIIINIIKKCKKKDDVNENNSL